MWEIMDDNFNCDDCTNDFPLPPPKFELPPPPMPPSLKNYVKCNEDDFVNRINDWDNDMCDAIPIFEASFYSSPMTQALTLVGVFSFILILVISISVIYVRRLMNQKNGGCKELKNLVKHTFHLSQTNFTDQRNYLASRQKLQNENYYEECNRCNQYTVRQAHDFISYEPTNAIAEYHSANSMTGGAIGGYMEPLRHHDSQYTGYLGYNDFTRYYNNSRIQHNNYIQPSQPPPPPSLQPPSFTQPRPYDLYSRPYEDFDELPGYSRADTGYGGSSEGGDSNPNNSTRSSNTNSNSNSNSSNNSNNNSNRNSENYPEYVEIELVVPNLVLR